MSVSSRGAGLRAFLASLRPAPFAIDQRERWRMTVGAGIGVLFTALISRWLGGPGAAWLIAPLGASAVLVFGVPASPMAQPWSVVAGNTVSALVGIAFARYVPDAALAAGLAIACALALMLALRCLHPPGGAAAVLMVLAHNTAPDFALFPVLFNSLLLVAAGMVYNRLTGRAYPHPQLASAPAPGEARSRFSGADLDAVLARYNQVLDISRDDLESLLVQAEAEAYKRNLGELRCGEVMTRDPVVVHFGTPLLEAWKLLRRHEIKALPVVDRANRIAGIVTTGDFMRLANLDKPHGLGARLREALLPTRLTHSERPEVIGQIMTRNVRVASEHVPLAKLVPLFSSSGHHHLPIIDADRKLVGILTQTDLVRALHQAVRPGEALAA